MARERLESARREQRAGSPSSAVSLAYYAMLYAARAALSEEDRYAKTHSGTWTLFRETFVASDRVDAALAKQAQDVQKLREATDYDAVAISGEQASEIVDLAARFLAAVEAAVGP